MSCQKDTSGHQLSIYETTQGRCGSHAWHSGIQSVRLLQYSCNVRRIGMVRNAVGERVASGVYFYKLTAGDFSATRKMLIVK